jgi:hypothetical protein
MTEITNLSERIEAIEDALVAAATGIEQLSTPGSSRSE